ncbi:MAG: histidine phosphatase family protein [Actinomycetales bacterium]|nr:histidine phosphatase family protein [Actinomycetales bacterium]
MPANRIHLIRHGEVHNPGQVLYGRLPHFRLSDRGHEMAALAAQSLREERRPISALVASPLLRTRESAEHIQEALGLELVTDQRVIEPYNIFEGRKLTAKHIALRPHLLYHFRNPSKPTWGEPYESVLNRMLEAITELSDSVIDGDVAIVTHQMPIVMVQRHAAGLPLAHNPAKRNCSLSSITSLEFKNGKLVQVDYREPAAALHAVDKGAV